MKFVIIFSLLFAIADANEDCTEERAESCLNHFLKEEGTAEEVCKDMRNSIDCFKSVIDDCSEDEKDEDVEKGLTDLENVFKEQCAESGGNEEIMMKNDDEEIAMKNDYEEIAMKNDYEEIAMKNDYEEIVMKNDYEAIEKCLEENVEYIYECWAEGVYHALKQFYEMAEMNENTLICNMYAEIGDCMVVKIREKCGDNAGDLAKEKFNDHPEEIAQACEAAKADNVDLSDVYI